MKYLLLAIGITFASHTIAGEMPRIISTKEHGKIAEDLYYTLERIETTADNTGLGRYVRMLSGNNGRHSIAELFTSASGQGNAWLTCYNKDNDYQCTVRPEILAGDRNSAAYAMYLGMRSMLVSKQTINRQVQMLEHENTYYYKSGNVVHEFACVKDKKNDGNIAANDTSGQYSCFIAKRAF